VKSPFYLINNEKPLVCEKTIVLMNETSIVIPIKFVPCIDLNNPYSKDYKSILWLEYNEHPNKVYTVKFVKSALVNIS